MVLNLFSGLYIIFFLIAIGMCVGLHFLLRKKSEKTKIWVLWSFLSLNFILHFVAPALLETETTNYLRRIFLMNICAISAVFFPFMFWSKDRFIKSGMIYVGIFTGLLAMFIPSEFYGQTINWDMTRYMFQHALIWIVPVLMLSLNLHRPSFKDLWVMPVYMFIAYLMIVANDAILEDIGLLGDMRDVNPNMQWVPFFDMLPAFGWLIPNIFKVKPINPDGIHYWPVFYLIIPFIVYGVLFETIINVLVLYFPKLFKKRTLKSKAL